MALTGTQKSSHPDMTTSPSEDAEPKSLGKK